MHSRLDSVRFCVVPQEEQWVVDHDQGWALSLRHPYQLLCSSSNDVSCPISEFTAENAPSNFFEFFSLLSLGGILLNFFYFRDDLRFLGEDCIVWSLYTACRFSGNLLTPHSMLCAELLEEDFRSGFLRHLELQLTRTL